MSSRKARMMRLSGAWNELAYTTHDASTGGGLDGGKHARVRAVPLNETNSPKSLQRFLEEARTSGAPFTSVVGVRPTGWTHANNATTTSTKGGGKIAAAPAGGREFNGELMRRPSLGVGRGDRGSSAEEATASSVARDARQRPSPPSREEQLGVFRSRLEDGSGEFEARWDDDDQDDESAAWGAAGGEEEETEGREGGAGGEGRGGVVATGGVKGDEPGGFAFAIANCFACLAPGEAEEAKDGGGRQGVPAADGGIEEEEGERAVGRVVTAVGRARRAERPSPLPPVSPAGGRWTGKKPWVEGNARVYSLPYSEHSSFTQLRDFVRAVRPK